MDSFIMPSILLRSPYHGIYLRIVYPLSPSFYLSSFIFLSSPICYLFSEQLLFYDYKFKFIVCMTVYRNDTHLSSDTMAPV